MKGLERFDHSTYYHVVNHAVGNENLFRNDENYLFFLRKYAMYMPSVCDTIAYCLMPNHIQFLLRTQPEKRLVETHIRNSIFKSGRWKDLPTPTFNNLVSLFIIL